MKKPKKTKTRKKFPALTSEEQFDHRFRQKDVKRKTLKKDRLRNARQRKQQQQSNISSNNNTLLNGPGYSQGESKVNYLPPHHQPTISQAAQQHQQQEQLRQLDQLGVLPGNQNIQRSRELGRMARLGHGPLKIGQLLNGVPQVPEREQVGWSNEDENHHLRNQNRWAHTVGPVSLYRYTGNPAANGEASYNVFPSELIPNDSQQNRGGRKKKKRRRNRKSKTHKRKRKSKRKRKRRRTRRH